MTISRERIEDAICRVNMHHVQGTGSVVCALILMNGHVVIGEAHCPANTAMSVELAANLARQDADRKVAEFLAYQDRGFIKEKCNG